MALLCENVLNDQAAISGSEWGRNNVLAEVQIPRGQEGVLGVLDAHWLPVLLDFPMGWCEKSL